MESFRIPRCTVLSRLFHSSGDTIFRHLLTYAAGGKHSYGIIRRRAVREEWFEDVDTESQGYDGLAARTHYHTFNP